MTQKKVFWYRISNVPEDLKITRFRIAKETATRLYLHKDSQTGWHQTTKFVTKISGYERYFRIRTEAVAAKIKVLKKVVKTRTELKREASRLLAEFKKQEGLS